MKERFCTILMLLSFRLMAVVLVVLWLAAFTPEFYPNVKEVAFIALGIGAAAFVSGFLIWFLEYMDS